MENIKELRHQMWQTKTDWGITETGKNHEEETGPGHFGKGPKNWMPSDERVREDVCEALFENYDVDASDIEVFVAEGIVTLKGSVQSRLTKKIAQKCVEYIRGVQDVRNDLKIMPHKKEEDRGIMNPGFKTGFS